MRWIRLLLALVSAGYRSRLRVDQPSELKFRVWITDVDASIMNHAALMTVMEAGRIDLMVRTGFFRLARKERWYFPSSAISVQFFRPLKTFQKAVLVTRVLHVEESSIYLEQKVSRAGKDVACCIVKSTIKKGRETLDIPAIIRRLGNETIPQEGGEVIESLERENRLVRERGEAKSQ